MPVFRKKWITRDFVRENPEFIFVFGDNLARSGLGGQAFHMRGEDNTLGFSTKKKPDNNPHSFYSDDDFDFSVLNDTLVTHSLPRIYTELTPQNRCLTDINDILELLKEDTVVVIPSDGLGNGLSKLNEYAPKFDNFIKNFIHHIETSY
jgi:hypothetical protein